MFRVLRSDRFQIGKWFSDCRVREAAADVGSTGYRRTLMSKVKFETLLIGCVITHVV